MTSRNMEKKRLVSQLAILLKNRGLGATVLILLEAGGPLAFLIGQLMWVLQPAMGLVIPRERLADLAVILEDPKAIKQLIGYLSDGNEAEVGPS
jgi:hypothetical protein